MSTKSKEYYQRLDKRSKEYRDWKKLQDVIEEEVLEIESEGLGDTVEKVLKKTGVKKIVEAITDDCGCDKRKAKLNQIFRYKRGRLVKSEYNWIKEYSRRHDPEHFSGKDVDQLKRIYSKVLGVVKPPTCANCNGSVKVMNDVVDALYCLVKAYEDEK